MKSKFFNSVTFLSLVCLTVFVFVGCGGDEDDKGNGSYSNSLSDYITIKNVSAHYIGNIVVADFQIENKSKKDINDLNLYVHGLDDNGVEYYNYTYNIFISAGEGTQFMGSSLSNFTINRGETRNLRVVYKGTSIQSGISKVKVFLEGQSNQLNIVRDNSIAFTASVSDSRETKNTIWTNDDKMNYGVPVIKRSGDDLLVTFSVTNKTGVNLPQTHLSVNSLDNGNGQSFSYYSYVFIDDDTQAHGSIDFTINSGETRKISVFVRDFYKYSARCVNAQIIMTSSYYYFANEALYLVSVEL